MANLAPWFTYEAQQAAEGMDVDGDKVLTEEECYFRKFEQRGNKLPWISNLNLVTKDTKEKEALRPRREEEIGDTTSLASNKSTNTNKAASKLMHQLWATADQFIKEHGGNTQSHDADALSVSSNEGANAGA